MSSDENNSRSGSPEGGKKKKEQMGGDNRFWTDVQKEKPIPVTIFSNGRPYARPVNVKVSRARYRNWVNFLDHLTRHPQVETHGAVHHVYDKEGKEVRHFKDLEAGETYIAANGYFFEGDYGSKKAGQWHRSGRDTGMYKHTTALDSKESVEKYLDQRDYKPEIGDIWDDSDFDLRRHGGGKPKPQQKRRRRPPPQEQEKEEEEEEKKDKRKGSRDRRSRRGSQARDAESADERPDKKGNQRARASSHAGRGGRRKSDAEKTEPEESEPETSRNKKGKDKKEKKKKDKGDKSDNEERSKKEDSDDEGCTIL